MTSVHNNTGVKDTLLRVQGAQRTLEGRKIWPVDAFPVHHNAIDMLIAAMLVQEERIRSLELEAGLRAKVAGR